MTSGKTAVALGNFDGLHIGHRQVLKNVLSFKNEGLLPYVLLFDEHPLTVVTGKAPKEIMQDELKSEMLTELGIGEFVIPFREIMEMSAETFVRDVLKEKLNAGAVCCGYNYRFARGGNADSAVLAELCEKYGIKTAVCGEIDFKNEPVSSTRIRKLLEDGEIEEANKMLAVPFSYRLIVTEGDKRGHILGAPTINQKFPDNFAVPKFGVYVSETEIDGEKFRAITNIGVRPTVDDKTLLSETHIIGFSGDLYGKAVKTSLLSYIRPEKKFDSLTELSEQIKKDIEAGRRTVSADNSGSAVPTDKSSR
ncbi:MAG: bifunctional riboflavin kinase/FAD synthetase [Clostridiales bacterium]|nr:bifunctional riboflavin kinase/FAD synthetase [Clostridiales bacterium]